MESEHSVEEILAWVESCPQCHQGLATLESWQEEVGYPDLAVVADERNRALQMWEELKAVPTEELADRIGEEHCFWAMAFLLPKKSVEAARNSSDRCLELAQIAVAVSSLLDPNYYTPRLLKDMDARVWAYLGNAQRVRGDLNLADRAFERAQAYLQKGTGTLLSRAVFLDLLGSLRKDQGQYEEAIEVLGHAAKLYEATGQSSLVGKVQLMLGMVEELRGNTEGAVSYLTEAQSLISPEKDQRLYSHCQHFLLGCLTRAGYFEEAELRLPILRKMWEDARDTKGLLMLRWLEANILHGLGKFNGARSVYEEVQAAFSKVGLEISVALINLELAVLSMESDSGEDVLRLTTEAHQIFRDNGAEKEALAALSILVKAAEAAQITASLTKSVTEFLRAEGKKPLVRFDPPQAD